MNNNDEKMKTRILVETIFEERKNLNADESVKKSEKEMVAKLKEIIEKEVKKNEV